MNNMDLLSKMHSIGLSLPEERMPQITDEPKIPGFFCYANEKASNKYDVNETFGQGFDTNLEIAKIKATGEFLERLCLSNPLESKINKKFSYFKDPLFFDPSSFFSYSNDQFSDKKKILDKIKKGSYKGYEVYERISKKKFYIPGQMIFLSSHFDTEHLLRKEQTSSGAAFGKRGTGKALKGGLLELVERDSSISTYLKKESPPIITNFSGEIKSLLNYLERYRLETYILDVTNDLKLPSVISVVLDKTGIGDSVNIGSRSDFNYNLAIKGAILESLQCRGTSRINRKIGGGYNFLNEEIHTMEERFEYWANIERINDLDFWINSKNFVNYEEISKNSSSMDNLIKTFSEKGYHIFVADITLPEIKEKGFETLKVVVPELHPLYLDERAKSLYSLHHGEIKENLELKPHPLT